MRNFFKLFGIIAVVAVMVVFTGCAMLSSVGGTADPHGLFATGGVVGAVGGEDTVEVASYSVILGLFDSGYADYAVAVKEAEASGKQITTITKWYYFAFKTTAYAK